MADAAYGRLLQVIVRAAGCPAAIVARNGTTIAPDNERSGTNRVACYQAGSHAVLWCDPALAVRLGELVSDTATLADVGFRAWANEAGGEVIGQAVMKTLGSADRSPATPSVRLHRFDWSSAADLELMRRFVEACDPDDLDEAEVAIDELDAMAVGLVDQEGEIGAYASSRPFEYDESFGDIGVVVRADLRGKGWGRAVVSSLILDVLDPVGVEPLYRCDPENIESDRLSAALGFETVVSLTAAQFPEN